MAAPADPLSRDELLAQRHFIAGLARRLVGDDASDDVAQETYVRLLRDANPRPRSVRAWLRTVVGNVVRQLRRGETRRLAREAAVAIPSRSSTPSASDLAAQLDLQRKLIEQVLSLAPIYREVVLLHFHGERTIAQVAADLGVPVETVRSRLRRALAELRTEWSSALGGRREGIAALLPLTRLAPGPVLSAGAAIVMSNGAKLGIAAGVVALAGAVWLLADPGIPSHGTIQEQAALPEPAEVSADDGSARIVAERVSDESTAGLAASASEAMRFGSVRATVTWVKTKGPAAGIPVHFRPEDESLAVVGEVQGRTDAQGLFVAERVPAGSVIASAAQFLTHVGSSDHRELFERECTSRIVVKPGETTEVALSLRVELEVDGIVLDPDGAPVSGASIWVASIGRWPTIAGQVFATTDADGRFHLPCVEGAGVIAAIAPGFAPSYARHLQRNDDRRQFVELQFTGDGGTISGHVRDVHHQPIESALVYVGGPYGRGRTLPDGSMAEPGPQRIGRSLRDGSFELDGTATGSVDLIVRAFDHAPFRQKLVLDADVPQVLDIELLGGGILCGIVTTEAGDPVANVTVRVAPPESELAWNHREVIEQSTRTDEDGRFQIDHVMNGPIEATIDAGTLGTAKLAFELEEGETREWNATLSNGLAIRGRVLDEHGAPCVGWTVRTRPEQGERGVDRPPDVETDGEGRFAVLRCRGRRYQLAIREPGKDYVVRSFSPLVVRDVEPGGEELRLEVPDATRATSYFVGRVVDDDGHPIESASLYLCQSNGGSDMVGLNAGGDSFRLGPLPPGDYWMRATARGYPDLDLGTRALPSEGSLDLGAIVLPRPGLVEIRVRRADSAPVTDEDCGIWSEHHDVSASLQRVGDTFRSEPLAPGPYFVCGGEGMAALWTPFEVVAGQTAKLEAVVEPGGIRSFKLTRESSAALPERVDVTLSGVDGRVIWTHSWDRGRDGSFVIAQRFARGRFVVSFAGNDGSKGEAILDVVEAVDATESIEVTLH